MDGHKYVVHIGSQKSRHDPTVPAYSIMMENTIPKFAGLANTELYVIDIESQKLRSIRIVEQPSDSGRSTYAMVCMFKSNLTDKYTLSIIEFFAMDRTAKEIADNTAAFKIDHTYQRLSAFTFPSWRPIDKSDDVVLPSSLPDITEISDDIHTTTSRGAIMNMFTQFVASKIIVHIVFGWSYHLDREKKLGTRHVSVEGYLSNRSQRSFIHSNMSISYRNPKTFYGGMQRIALSIHEQNKMNPKIALVLDIFLNNIGKTVIYVPFKETCLHPFINEVNKWKKIYHTRIADPTSPFYKFDYAEITGDISNPKRQLVRREFNNRNRNSAYILFITSAGKQSLDLADARNIILISPDFSDEAENQIIGRVIRRQSHINSEEKYVNVWRILLEKPKNREDDLMESADHIIFDDIHSRKRKVLVPLINTFNMCTIGNNMLLSYYSSTMNSYVHNGDDEVQITQQKPPPVEEYYAARGDIDVIEHLSKTVCKRPTRDIEEEEEEVQAQEEEKDMEFIEHTNDNSKYMPLTHKFIQYTKNKKYPILLSRLCKTVTNESSNNQPHIMHKYKPQSEETPPIITILPRPERSWRKNLENKKKTDEGAGRVQKYRRNTSYARKHDEDDDNDQVYNIFGINK